jgi:hypothetical protein
MTGVAKVGYLYGKKFGSKNSLSQSEGSDGVEAGRWNRQCSETLVFKLQRLVKPQKKAYNIQNKAKV